MSDLLRISLVQFDVLWENPIGNRQKLDILLEPLKGRTDLILLPEMYSTGFSMHAKSLAESMEGDTIGWMRTQAENTNAAVAGSLIVKELGHYYNRFLFVLPSGDIFCYDKKHLFSMGGEDQYFSHGIKRVFVDYCGWRIALFICYDLRFPVWCRTMKVADLVLFSANWPAARTPVWQTLIRARAIENQLYVAGVNRTGTDGAGVIYTGESTLIDPKGRIVCTMNDQSDVVTTCVVSLEELNRFRKKFPVSDDDDLFEINV